MPSIFLLCALFVALPCSLHATSYEKHNNEQIELVVNYILPHKTRTYSHDESLVIARNPIALNNSAAEQALIGPLQHILQDTYNQKHSLSWQQNIIKHLVALKIRLNGLSTSLGKPFFMSFLTLLNIHKKPIFVCANGYQYSFIRKKHLLVLTVYKTACKTFWLRAKQPHNNHILATKQLAQ